MKRARHHRPWLWRWKARSPPDSAPPGASAVSRDSLVPTRYQPAAPELCLQVRNRQPRRAPEVKIFAIQGNFHELPRYTYLFRSNGDAEHRRRLFCMFGYTFGNLQNEIHFVRNSLLGYTPGDFLLLNVTLAVAPPMIRSRFTRPIPFFQEPSKESGRSVKISGSAAPFIAT
jgi:hypothetical protein